MVNGQWSIANGQLRVLRSFSKGGLIANFKLLISRCYQLTNDRHSRMFLAGIHAHKHLKNWIPAKRMPE